MRALALKPPELVPSPETDWLLLRAFAPPELAAPAIVPTLALDLARKLGLASRIAGRTPSAVLDTELGPLARELSNERFVTAATDALLMRALELTAQAARRIGAPLVGLKFAALRVRHLARAGQRRAHDVDVLTCRAMAQRLRSELLAQGCSEPGVRGHDHQLAPVMTPDGVPVEVHLHIPGVRLPGSRRFVGADELLAAGLVDAHFGLAVPDIAVVTAHALAHGFLQNAGAPGSHSLLCTFADLSDILGSHPGALSASIAFLKPSFDDEDGALTGELVRQLESGNLAEARRGPGGTLLRHALAARLDARYASALRLRLLTQPLSDRPFPLGLATALQTALFPTPKELEAIYGAPLSGPSLAVRRLLRPADLAWRALNAGASRIIARWR